EDRPRTHPVPAPSFDGLRRLALLARVGRPRSAPARSLVCALDRVPPRALDPGALAARREAGRPDALARPARARDPGARPRDVSGYGFSRSRRAHRPEGPAGRGAASGA